MRKDANRLTVKNFDKPAWFRACSNCPYEVQLCKDNVQMCPQFHYTLEKLAEYEDLEDLDVLKRSMNERVLETLPFESETEGMWIYGSHLGGGIYSSSFEQDWESLYCEECGDSDREYGYFGDFLSAWDGCGGNDEEPDVGLFVALFEMFYPSKTLYTTNYDLWYEWDDADEDFVEAIDAEMIKKCLKRLRSL